MMPRREAREYCPRAHISNVFEFIWKVNYFGLICMEMRENAIVGAFRYATCSGDVHVVNWGNM